jgi:hypothetical protein
MNWIIRHRALVAFIVLALVTMLAINRSASDTAKTAARAASARAAQVNYRSAILSCERANVLRMTISSQIAESSKAEIDQVKFMDDAAEAHKATYEHTHTPSDYIAWHQYAALARDSNAHIHFKPLPLTKCKTVILKP